MRMKERGTRREMVGTVVSDKMQKTVVVETRRHVPHPQYRKVMLRRGKFVAHDEKETASMGDVVRIRESRPLSRTKRWTVIAIVRQSKIREEAHPATTKKAPAKKTKEPKESKEKRAAT